MKLQRGDLVKVYEGYHSEIKGYIRYPGSYDYHKSEMIPRDSCGVVLERGIDPQFLKILVGNKALWFWNGDWCKIS